MGSSSSSSSGSVNRHDSDDRISIDDFRELEVTDIYLRKCFLGWGVVSGITSIPSTILTGSTCKHYWIVLVVKLSETIKRQLGWY